MYTKFKIGDLVKIMTPGKEDHPHITLRRHGDVVTIWKITKTGKYKIDNSRAEYNDDELVLVKGI